MNAIVLAFFLLVSSVSLFSQNTESSYLDFFGKKFQFKKGELIYDSKYFKESKKKVSKYNLSGIGFLNKKSEKHMSQKNLNYFINKTVYSISNSMNFYDFVDSVKINDIDKKLDFKVVSENNNYKILGFKIYADCVDYELTFTETNERTTSNWDFSDSLDYKVTYTTLDKKEYKNFMIYDAVNNESKKQLISIFDELKNCSRLILNGMYYFDKKDNREYYIRMDILLYK